MDRTGEPTPFGISGLVLLGDMTPVEIKDLAQWLELDLMLPG